MAAHRVTVQLAKEWANVPFKTDGTLIVAGVAVLAIRHHFPFVVSAVSVLREYVSFSLRHSAHEGNAPNVVRAAPCRNRVANRHRAARIEGHVCLELKL